MQLLVMQTYCYDCPGPAALISHAACKTPKAVNLYDPNARTAESAGSLPLALFLWPMRAAAESPRCSMNANMHTDLQRCAWRQGSATNAAS